MNGSHLMRNVILVPIILAAAWKIFSKSTAEKDLGPLRKVKKVNLKNYMGAWYVIANIPQFTMKKPKLNGTLSFIIR